jgi:NADPH2:quinone reductase
MKALLCSEWGGPETLAVADVPDPVPAPGEALIRVHAAGVNFPDGLIIQNKYQFKPPLPFIPGNECAGIVEAVGPGVSSVKVGERVIALPRIGGFAELLACPAQSLISSPPRPSS